MQLPPPQQAIASVKVKSRRYKVYLEPKRVTNLACDVTKACLGTLFFIGLIFSAGALVTLATVSIRCLIAEW